MPPRPRTPRISYPLTHGKIARLGFSSGSGRGGPDGSQVCGGSVEAASPMAGRGGSSFALSFAVLSLLDVINELSFRIDPDVDFLDGLAFRHPRQELAGDFRKKRSCQDMVHVARACF